MSVVLQVKNLHVRYGKVRVVHGTDVLVKAGQIVTIIGPNGAGKSTMLAAIMGALPANAGASGELLYQGHNLNALAIEQRQARGLSLVPEKRELFTSMSVSDNLMLGAYTRKRLGERNWLDQLDLIYTLFPRLKERRAQQAGTLSGGERQMLAMGRALMAKPQVLMLDEPSLGLAPLVTREILNVISQLRSAGVATLLVEQNARAALQIADYGYVLEMGQIALQGAATEIQDNPQVIQTYLGLAKKRHD